MRDLDSDLIQARDRLFDEIEQPPLADLQRRAGTLRRRRAAVRSGAVALAVAAVVVAVVPTLTTPDRPPPQVAAPTGAIYRSQGITINGLTAVPLQVDGNLADVEFVDPTHGYLLSGCDESGCDAVATSSDGGGTWAQGSLPAGIIGRLDLVGFPDGTILLTGSQGTTYATADDGRTWQRLTARDGATLPAVAAGQIMRYDGPATIAVWSPTEGRIGTLASRPGLDEIRWVAPVASGDAWWVGGTIGGAPAVAVSRDGGARWTPTPLGSVSGPVASVRVSTLGSVVYAVATDTDGTVRGIYHSADSGATFTRTGTGGTPAAIAGDLVPLLDGRVLAVSPGPADDREAGDWWVSRDDGRTFVEAELPLVGRIDRTVAGYVANDFFRDYAAFSRDGTTWRKLEIW